MKSSTKLNKENKTGITFVVGILTVSLIIFTFYSYARYMNTYDGNISINFANWEIKLDDIKLSQKGNVFEKELALIPFVSGEKLSSDGISGDRMSGDIPIVKAGKIMPGDSGYFDISINPTNTEVSVKYQVEVDLQELPETIVVDKYRINDDSIINTSGDRIITVDGKILLEDKEKLDENDIKNIRFFWNWDEDDEDIPEESTIKSKISIQQILE